MESEEGKYNEIRADKTETAHLQDLDRPALIKKCLDYKSSLEKIEKEIEVYKSLLAKTFQQNDHLKSQVPTIRETEYNRTWSWVNKIVFVLKKIDRPLLSSDIITLIIPYEPVLQYSRYKAQAFSANLTKAVKYGRVRAYKLHGSRGYYYVLPNWLDDEGQLQENYAQKIFFK